MSREAPLRIAIVGGNRGGCVQAACSALPQKARVVAVCDTDPAVLDRWKRDSPEVERFVSFQDMLERQLADAVFVATPPALHASQSIAALEAGYHVLSEVYAISTIDEAWQLVETVEKTGLVYMMAENYCYLRANMMVLHLVRGGLFGELTYAEGGYIHDCRALMLDDNRELTWRGRSRLTKLRGNGYPTHSLGPVAQWLGIGRGDELATTATFVTRAEGAWRYFAEVLGPDHVLAKRDAVGAGDSATTVITTARGRVIVLRVDTTSPRPHNMTHYVLQGSGGAYVSERWSGEAPLIWIDGLSRGSSPDGSAQWQALWELADDYEHPYWREDREAAEGAGHGGGDYFVLRDFLDSVLQSTAPPIDVYDAVTWSSIVPLSVASVAAGGVPVEIPRFRR